MELELKLLELEEQLLLQLDDGELLDSQLEQLELQELLEQLELLQDELEEEAYVNVFAFLSPSLFPVYSSKLQKSVRLSKSAKKNGSWLDELEEYNQLEHEELHEELEQLHDELKQLHDEQLQLEQLHDDKEQLHELLEHEQLEHEQLEHEQLDCEILEHERELLLDTQLEHEEELK